MMKMNYMIFEQDVTEGENTYQIPDDFPEENKIFAGFKFIVEDDITS